MINPPAVNGAQAAIGYTDIKGLEQLKDGSDASLKAAARQFESVFLDLWIKGMRKASESFGSGSYLTSDAVQTHQQMLDSQWAVHLSDSGGIGLAEVIERQLRGEAAPVERESLKVSPQASQSSRPPAIGHPSPQFEDRSSFVDAVVAAARPVVAASPIPLTGIVAQAVLETGWGQSVPHDADGSSSNNLFGIKATGHSGDAVNVRTKEFLLGQWTDRVDAFRKYPDIGSAVRDLVGMLVGSERYQGVIERVQEVAGDSIMEVEAFAHGLQASGYATDPRYAEKIKAVADTLRQKFGFDQ